MLQNQDRTPLAHRRPPATPLHHVLNVLWRGRLGYLFVLPTFVFVAIFFYYPAWTALFGAFTSWDGFNAPQLVGLENFRRAFADPVLGVAVRHNLVVALMIIVISLLPPLLVAELIFHLRSGRSQYVYRSLFVVPLIVPVIVFILLWTYFYSHDGLFNSLLGALGLEQYERSWLTSSKTALGALLFMGFPWISPFNLLVLYAGLQGISTDVFDAAKIDGSLGLHRILRIDLPLLAPQLRLLFILSLIGSTQWLLQPLLITNGGPADSTTVPVLFMYKTAVLYGEFGYSMAIAVLVFLATFLLTAVYNLLQRKERA